MEKGISGTIFEDSVIFCKYGQILNQFFLIFKKSFKFIIKNSKEDEGKCKTIIQIDGAIVFTSNVYTWEHPHSDSVMETEFEVATAYPNCNDLKGAIRNISIKAYH